MTPVEAARRFAEPILCRALIDNLVGHYLDSRLRAAPEERRRYCRPE